MPTGWRDLTPRYEVRVIRFDVLEQLDGAWVNDDFLALLDAMEYGDTATISSDELRDMCVLSLQDLEPRAAAALILRHKLGNLLSDGEIRNMSNEMLDEKLWEEHADMTLHEALFNIGSLLYLAFPLTCPEPDAVRVKLAVSAVNAPARAALSGTLSESFVVRLLGDGMDRNAVLHRRFGEQLVGSAFPEADKVIWTVCSQSAGEHAVEVEVVSSGYWLDALRDTLAYESHAYPDACA
jgi:hypothetical protein